MEQATSQQTTVSAGINWRYHFQQYGVAIGISIPIFLLFSVYLFYRRGYYDLYIINKILAGEAAVLFGIVLLIGPLSRYFSAFDRYVQYRKELGIVGFFLAIAHGIASYYFLPEHFPQAAFTFSSLPFVFGLLGSVILIAIFLVSNDWAMNAIGAARWWPIQYWGIRLAFLAIALHVFIMKWKGWIAWYKSGGGKELMRPEWPGAGLIVGWFIAFVVLVRLAEIIGPRFGKFIWYMSAVGFPLVIATTFWWGQQFVR